MFLNYPRTSDYLSVKREHLFSEVEAPTNRLPDNQQYFMLMGDFTSTQINLEKNTPHNDLLLRRVLLDFVVGDSFNYNNNRQSYNTHSVSTTITNKRCGVLVDIAISDHFRQKSTLNSEPYVRKSKILKKGL